MTQKTPLTHFDAQGAAHIVDVSAKPTTARTATATATIALSAQTLALVESGSAKKGDVLGHRSYRGHHGGEKNRRNHPVVPSVAPIPYHRGFHPSPCAQTRKTPYKHSCNRQNHPSNRRGNGGIDRRINRCPDDLRYVKGGR